MKRCKNCFNNFNGRYCNKCGQDSKIDKINFNYLNTEFKNTVFNIDKGFLFTIKDLFIRPGTSILDFIEGKRVKHLKPLSFVLISSIIFSLIEHKFDRQPFLEAFLSGFLSTVNDEANDSIGLLSTFNWIVSNYAYSILLIIPILSFSTWLAFIKSKFNYFEHLVINCYNVGQATIVLIFLSPFLFNYANNFYLHLLQIILLSLVIFFNYFFLFKKMKITSRFTNLFLAFLLLPFLFIVFLAIITIILMI